MLFTLATSIFLFSKLSCVRLGGEEWPASVAAVLYKIKVCSGVRNENFRLSPDTDNYGGP